VVTRGVTKQRFVMGTHDQMLNCKMKEAKKREVKTMERRMRDERLATGRTCMWTFSTQDVLLRETCCNAVCDIRMFYRIPEDKAEYVHLEDHSVLTTHSGQGERQQHLHIVIFLLRTNNIRQTNEISNQGINGRSSNPR
jgi:hypothetical protein